MSSGFVSLLAAGPGDPELLTVRAVQRLAQADVVAYDELVSPEVLALVSPSTECLAVGRRAGQGLTTYRIHPAVVSRAREGAWVVRLKAGEPMVFGRGGEEADALREAKIAFEIVPGVVGAGGRGRGRGPVDASRSRRERARRNGPSWSRI